MKKYKMTFEVTEKFDDLIDEESFKKDFKGNLLKICKYIYKEEGMGFIENEIKIVDVKFVK